MALWGAPVADPAHGIHGLHAAMGAVTRICQAWEEAITHGDLRFAVKIGLHSGQAMVGNVGTEQRYNYTAVGEIVNIAARLEGVPGLYACHIVMGPQTAALTHEMFLLCELDTIQVKGKETPLVIYEPLTPHAMATAAHHQYVAIYAQALTHYRAHNFVQAAALWDEAAHLRAHALPIPFGPHVEVANPAAVMAHRATAYTVTPPAMPWHNVWVLESK